MKIFLTVIIITLSFNKAFAKVEKNSHLSVILKALAPELQGSHELKSFQTKSCSVQKKKWVLMLITQNTFKETIKFTKGCDISGSFSPQMNEFFPVDFKLRRLKEVKRLIGQMRISIIFGEVTKLKLELIKASYFNAKNVVQKEFKLDYSFEIDPFDPNNFLKRDLGGTLSLMKKNKLLKKIDLK